MKQSYFFFFQTIRIKKHFRRCKRIIDQLNRIRDSFLQIIFYLTCRAVKSFAILQLLVKIIILHKQLKILTVIFLLQWNVMNESYPILSFRSLKIIMMIIVVFLNRKNKVNFRLLDSKMFTHQILNILPTSIVMIPRQRQVKINLSLE